MGLNRHFWISCGLRACTNLKILPETLDQSAHNLIPWSYKNIEINWHQRLTPIILATQEAEIGRIEF
jgi:hypothetical protein